jgi:hypothetical protein
MWSSTFLSQIFPLILRPDVMIPSHCILPCSRPRNSLAFNRAHSHPFAPTRWHRLISPRIPHFRFRPLVASPHRHFIPLHRSTIIPAADRSAFSFDNSRALQIDWHLDHSSRDELQPLASFIVMITRFSVHTQPKLTAVCKTLPCIWSSHVHQLRRRT